MRRHVRSRISVSNRFLQPSPTSTSKRVTVSLWVLVIRSVERIELPSTRQLMILGPAGEIEAVHMDGSRYLGILSPICPDIARKKLICPVFVLTQNRIGGVR